MRQWVSACHLEEMFTSGGFCLRAKKRFCLKTEEVNLSDTIWVLIPLAVTMLMAILTKEVYMSLGIGIFAGCAMYNEFSILPTLDTMFSILYDSIGTHAYVLIFLVLLGILVEEISCSSAARAYEEWAARVSHGKRSILFSTMGLGILIFIDDYFNCVTVGNAMRRITDRFSVTRAKLAYIIDATAAPVCVIAPVSTWAAAVSATLPSHSESEGFSLFLRTIPFNFYAWLTLLFMVFIIWSGKDYFTMATYEKDGRWRAELAEYDDEDDDLVSGEGSLSDLIWPILVLIVSSISCILYTGGYHIGMPLLEAISQSEPVKGLAMGTCLALIFTILFYFIRHVLSYKQICECLTMGFVNMTASIFVLCLTWTLAGICGTDYLNLGSYISRHIGQVPYLSSILPALFFITAFGLSITTGTSWGTFGILIPVALSTVPAGSDNALILSVSAILAGAVGGDHVSPISSTTILASASAQCRHIDHVNTQIPYVAVVAACCTLGYLIAGIFDDGWIGAAAGLTALAAAALYMNHVPTTAGKDIFRRIEMKDREGTSGGNG